MIHVKQNFFNDLASEIRSTYFPNENHGTTENKAYHKATYDMELFNNCGLTYRQLIGRLAKSCNTSTYNIHSIVEKYVDSFGFYEYKPSKK